MNDFEYKDPCGVFIDLLNNANFKSNEDLYDTFIIEVNKILDFILKEHEIIVTKETTLYEKNELLSSLLLIQDLEDYTPIARVLESLEPDADQLSSILGDLCMLDQTKLLEIIEWFNPNILFKLKEFVAIKEELRETSNDNNNLDLISGLRLFFKCFEGFSLGKILLENNCIIGAKFADYLKFVESDIIMDSNEVTALNIYSVLIISSDGYNTPLLTYRKHSYELLQDLNKVSKIEVILLQLISKFEEYRKAQSEQNRLS